MGETNHILLVPGFFGFANLGDLAYFGHVVRALKWNFAEAGINAEVHVVKTRPTAAFRLRATRLFEALSAHSGHGEPIHIVGHSSGGIDARLVLASDTVIPNGPPDALLGQVKSVVTIATPHYGTP